MRLLFVSPDTDTAASVAAALQRHRGLSVTVAPHAHAAQGLLAQAQPDAVLMLSHPNLTHWISELEGLGWSGPYVVLVRPADHGLAHTWMQRRDVVCLAPEDVEAPFFPALLERLLTVSPSGTSVSAPAGPATDRTQPALDPAFTHTLAIVANSLTKSLDPETVLDRLLVALVRLILCDAADVRLVHGDDVVVARTYGAPEPEGPQTGPEGPRTGPEDPQTGPFRYSLQATRNLRQVAEERRPVIVEDTATYEGWITRPGAGWIRSHLTAPLFLDETLVGFLAVSSARPRAFGPRDIQVIETLAPLAAVALHNARLYQSLSLERDQLVALAAVDQQILSMSDSPQVVLRTILGHALRLLGLTKGISILTSYSGNPEFIHICGMQNAEQTRKLIRMNGMSDHHQIEQHGPDWHLALDHAPTEPAALAAWAEEEGIRATLIVPLWLQGSLVGRIALFDTAPRQWREREVQVVKMLAGQAAMAIDKAMLNQKLRQRLREAESLNRVLQAAGSTLDPEQILRNVCAEARHILKVPFVGASMIANGTLRLVAETVEGPATQASGRDAVLADEAAVQQAFRAGTPLVFEDVGATTPPWLSGLFGAPTHSALVIPLTVRDTTIGLLHAESATHRTFLSEEVRLMALIAAAITPTLENAWLFRQVEEARAASESAYAELRRLDSLKSQFIQNVSHEFRTPLAIVKGYVDLIVDGVLEIDRDSDLMPAIQAIHTHTDCLVRLVESITTVEDAEVGNLVLTPQPLKPICHAVVKANWQKALRRQIEIEARIPDDLPNVDLDAEGFLRALNQVVDNAIKFSQPGNKVLFDVFRRDHHIWLQVRDEGTGIPRSELKAIFDRFYQVNGATTRLYGGLGIGLSLVREVVERHHGSVWAESPGEGQGTTISIVLPLAAQSEPLGTARAEPSKEDL